MLGTGFGECEGGSEEGASTIEDDDGGGDGIGEKGAVPLDGSGE
jgi:hypothetical protein